MSEQSPQAKLTVKNLYKIFGPNPKAALKLHSKGLEKEEIFAETGSTVAVGDVNLEIYEGEIFVIMGLSGSGKSTLVRLFNRLIEPSQGQVLIDGEDVVAMSDARLRQVRREKISMVFQSFALMPHLTNRQNVAFGLELAGVPEAERNERAQVALDQVGLGAYGESYPDELSGGMRQRVGLARALANDPAILLMDEAFSALDPLIRTEMQDELIQLQARDKRTIIFISHDLDEAMRIGNRIAIMQNGSVVQVGTPDEILRQPANDYVRSFFKEVNVSQVYTAGDLARRTQLTFPHRAGQANMRSFLKRMSENDRDYGFLLDEDKHFIGVISVESLKGAITREEPIQSAILPDLEAVPADTPIRDMFNTAARFPCPVPIVDAEGRHVGSISKAVLLETLSPPEEPETEEAKATEA
ncbi:glycine betaine/L-proline ABC transporter ATP-binding protein ProV [Neisseria zalophi]|uniref:Quaternary amine transport ATP-binding protein n=1 Tax=Neisseria zalophi TaxID=640030 RepID=A0A5J6Q229_9NEIS|nr:glycine betaine/L-proline ABC transporter ATP-binding protein ProV [Neisseria zalophi]QEY27027.1 proline/glycine betaine ABC transporter ATP-binding protein ProV [Neisseria zalophi]